MAELPGPDAAEVRESHAADTPTDVPDPPTDVPDPPAGRAVKPRPVASAPGTGDLAGPDAAAAAARILESLRGSRGTVELLVVSDSEGRAAGARMLVRPDAVEGSLGDPELDAAALAAASRERLARGHGGSLHNLQTPAGRRLQVYAEGHRPRQELIVVGAGHIAQPLATLGTLLDFEVTVLDDRPEFATRERFPEAAAVRTIDFADPLSGIDVHAGCHFVLVTRGHKYDYECLRRLLARHGDAQPAYIGMIGSRRRVRATFIQLEAEGIPHEVIARVRAPVGLDIGAQTPAEIAISVLGEMILERRGGTGAPLRSRERIVERFLAKKPPAGSAK
ncbi:MAG: XdhC family protein [Gammaproteobacteria bacterium]|nr:XdhC family protein [Gammaproteobacteria bacterium]